MNEQLLIILGTFRSPVVYLLGFNTRERKLSCLHVNEASGGHSWLHVSSDQRFLYTTVWDGQPRVASYRVIPSHESGLLHPTVRLINEAKLLYLSGYVATNGSALFSASGPQVDVFDLDPLTGGFASDRPKQSLPFVSDRTRDNGDALDFGGLRNGGHSADLSPNGEKLYVADIGRNCVWVYSVSKLDNTLVLASKYASKRDNDGPRHAWPHPNGKIVYVLQEHSSVVDVLEHVGDSLVWRQGGRILPLGLKCDSFWADEVRLDPSCGTLIASTRGLSHDNKGYVCSWNLLPSGLIEKDLDSDIQDDIPPTHIYKTTTSGGWANAISPAPRHGPNGSTWLTLTDSEIGSLVILEYTRSAGFSEVDRYTLPQPDPTVVAGASVAVWL